MKVTAQLNGLRIAPRKAGLVVNLIRGLDIAIAKEQLENTIKGSVEPVAKLLNSAIANAENNFGLDKDNLYVSEIVVGAGPMLKRWMPKAYGRAGQILKRTSSIKIVLDERIEGKGRKTKEQMEKERKAREEKRKKEEKARLAEQEKKEPEQKEKTKEKPVLDKKETSKKAEKKSWGSKIFRRKSM